jgi:hypothetical protein
MKISFRLWSILSLILIAATANSQAIRFSSRQMPVDSSGYGHGASFGAYTRNGRPSLFVIAYGTANYLYENTGGLFKDIAAAAGVQFGSDHDRGMAAADFDNDGDLDIYLSAGYTGNVLWRNNGNETFTDITSESGTYLGGQGQGVAWGDCNRDGRLDLFVCRTDGGNRLFIQNRDGRFYENSGDISEQSESLQPFFFDVNDDGHLDILVTRRTDSSNLLYINRGDGSFSERAQQWRIDFAGANSQGAAAGDYDRDGDLDVFICDFSGHNLLFRNMGSYFEEAGEAAGVRSGSDRNRGAVFGDFNDDGWPDLYVTRTGENKMFQNNGGLAGQAGTFTQVSAASGANDGDDGYSPSIADYDDDGDLDIFFTNTGQNSVLLTNSGPFNNWIEFRLRGAASNRDGVGAKLTAWLNGRPQAQAIIAGQGYLGTGSDLTAHFGLGRSRYLDSLLVQWPSGMRETYYRLAANQKMTLHEGQAPPRDLTAPVISNLVIVVITDNSAQSEWKTDEPSDARLEYGADSTALSAFVVDTNFVTTHKVSLINLKAATRYYFRIIAKDEAGNVSIGLKQSFTTLSTSSVDARLEPLPTAPALQNYPNPFRDFTRFEIDLPASGWLALKIVDLQGREVATLAEGWRNAGRHFFSWQINSKRELAAGIYFAILRYQNGLAFSSGKLTPVVELRRRVFYLK